MAISNQQALAFLRKYPVPFVCGLFSLAVLVFAYYRSDEADIAESTLQARTVVADRLDSNIKNSGQLKQQLDALSSAQSQIDARLLRASSLASNLQYFYRLEAETGTKLTDLRQGNADTDPKTNKNTYTVIPFSVSVEGDYPRLLAFLRALESSVHFCSFQGVLIAAAPANAGVSEDGRPLMMLTLRIELLGTQ